MGARHPPAGSKKRRTPAPSSSTFYEISPALLGRPQGGVSQPFLRLPGQGDLGQSSRRRRLLRRKGELQVIDDPVDDGRLGEEGDDLHPAAAFRTDHGVDFVDLPDHGRPALGRKTAELLLDNPQRRRRQALLADLSPVRVRV